ncbi:DNA cytosine methyltransferase [Methylocystis sp. WRRC1]|uniref:DNA cytosine methyltransferase n=1 Tax=Methylocystis sp. WRRC1 TaxID=1732014 RepID=UPI001D152DAC|nr:DNA cytosine methyltransferase [Methylocystis sp. WRRC1]MCC3246700.1 DNA cytosine methyltransferase [Methylocystis sp. WRRC1]
MSGPAIIDLFSGACGGWSLGMHRAGFRTVAACEADPWRRVVFSYNFPDARMYDDVRTLTASRIVSDLGRLPDAIVGSPPCQDASLANSRGKGVKGEKTGLFRDALRLVSECRPRWCSFENSPGLRTRGADWIIGELEGMGYAVWPCVVGADDIGAPHKRSRVWFIAADTAQIGRGAGRAWRSDRHASRAADETRRPAVGSDRNGDGLRIELRRSSGAHREGAAVITDDDRDAAREQMGRAGLAWADDWRDWHGGIAGHVRVDHGLPAWLARDCISAYGDAILPQISEVIGRSIWRVEAALSALTGPRP